MTKAARKERFIHFYDLGPSQMAEHIYKSVQDYVDMKAIHLNQSAPRRRWPDFIRENFLFACHDHYDKMISPFYPGGFPSLVSYSCLLDIRARSGRLGSRGRDHQGKKEGEEPGLHEVYRSLQEIERRYWVELERDTRGRNRWNSRA